jgi:asparagine synthase (glutamine-hydrolysing)
MCGWVGRFGQPTEEHLVRQAMSLMRTRGPDASGLSIGGEGAGSYALGHQRLAILDTTECGAQPMRLAERGVSIVYNGEIYNSPALRLELQAAGERFVGTSDTEVLLRGWAVWGDAVVDRIEGIFSFALLDEARRRVFLARDRLGTKPLYWTFEHGVLSAGSTPSAVLAVDPSVPRTLDRIALAQYLTLLWIPHPRTPWRAVHKLPPGHSLTFENGSVRVARYWSPTGAEASGDEELDLGASIETAVVRQLLSDVPVGVLLSGGLDSSLIAAIVDAASDTAVPALGAGYAASAREFETMPDDLSFARLVAQGLPGLAFEESIINAGDWSAVDDLAPHFDDPVADPAALTLYALCRTSPTKVLLSGVGAEELLAGYPRHAALRSLRLFSRTPRGVIAIANGLGRRMSGMKAGPGYALRRHLQRASRAVTSDRVPFYWAATSYLTPQELHGLMPDVAHEAMAELDAMCTPMRDTDLRSALEFDITQFLPNLNLAYADKASMAASIELRVPLLDELVVSSVRQLPVETLIANGVGKMPLREVSQQFVPQTILDRPKAGFGAPVRSWLRGPGEDELRARALSNGDLVDQAGAGRLYDDFVRRDVDVSLAIWALVSLDAWSRSVDAMSPAV